MSETPNGELEEPAPAGSDRGVLLWIVRVSFLLLCFSAAVWFWWVFEQVRQTASNDQAARADAIAVFGAAEYNGRASPVLKARLQHALNLYRRGLAPIIVTLGGGNDPYYSEGDVGRNFLLTHGVPADRIIAETSSSDTEQSVARLAAIARENHLNTILIVSDGTHLFRIRQLCAAQGLHVLLSPRQAGRSVSPFDTVERYTHEMVSYTLWRMHLH